MPFTTGDLFVYNGTQWENQGTLPGPFDADSPTFRVDSTNHRVGLGTSSPHSKLHVAGPIAIPVALVSGSSYTVAASDSLIRASVGPTAMLMTLPNASGITGREYTIKYKGGSTGDLNIEVDGGGTIDGQTTYTIPAFSDYSAITVISNGSNWDVLAKYNL